MVWSMHRCSTDHLSRTTIYKVPTMRRMMHAAALLFLTASTVQAQVNSFRALPALPASERSILAPSEESYEVAGAQAVVDQEPLTVGADAPCASPEFIPSGPCRTYSQLAVTMNCMDASPNLWCNYAAQRAALTARVMRHVDGQCNCFSCGGKTCSQLHSQPCSSGCGSSCETGCAPRINRYKQPFSTFHNAPSSACGKGCGVSCGHTSGCESGTCGAAGVSESTGCSSCGNNSLGNAVRPIPGNRVPTIMTAAPPKDRVAMPDFGASPANYAASRR